MSVHAEKMKEIMVAKNKEAIKEILTQVVKPLISEKIAESETKVDDTLEPLILAGIDKLAEGL